MLGLIIGGFIILMVGTATLPVVAQQVGIAQNAAYVDATSGTLVGLCTLFYALAIAVSAVAVAAYGLRDAGFA
jgi:uncharacterized membrane protein YhaH (DUF805 family)